MYKTNSGMWTRSIKTNHSIVKKIADIML